MVDPIMMCKTLRSPKRSLVSSRASKIKSRISGGRVAAIVADGEMGVIRIGKSIMYNADK